MADEIRFWYKTGETLTYGAYQPDGTVRTAAATALTEVAGTGYYKATDASVAAGDIIVVNDGTKNVGGGEYLPEVSTTAGTTSLETYIDTNVIGADGDTLESLSDQLDSVSGQSNTVFNVYGPGE